MFLLSKQTLFRSFRRSVLAVMSCSLLIGSMVLPSELRVLWQPYHNSILDVGFDDSGQPCMVFFRSESKLAKTGISYHLQQLVTAHSGLQPGPFTTQGDFRRSCNCNDSMLVTCRDGSIHEASQHSELTTLLPPQQTTTAWQIACSHDGRIMMAWDQQACAWDREYDFEIGSFSADFNIALPSSKRMSFFCDAGCEFVERDLFTGEVIRSMGQTGRIVTAALSPSERHLVVIDANQQLHVFDVELDALLWSGPNRALVPGQVESKTFGTHFVTFSPDGERFLCAFETNTEPRFALSIWETESSQLITTVAAHSLRINGAAFANNEALYSWANDGRLRKWDLTSPQPRLIEDWDSQNWRTPRG